MLGDGKRIFFFEGWKKNTKQSENRIVTLRDGQKLLLFKKALLMSPCCSLTVATWNLMLLAQI